MSYTILFHLSSIVRLSHVMLLIHFAYVLSEKNRINQISQKPEFVHGSTGFDQVKFMDQLVDVFPSAI